MYAIDAAQEVAQIKGYIKSERDKLTKFETEKQLIAYAKQGDNKIIFQQLADPHLSNEDLQDILANGADQEENYWLLYYAFHYQHKSPNTIVDEEENTVLHRAVLANQARIVQLCLQYKANKFIKNRPDPNNGYPEGRTSLDLAKEIGNQTIINLLEKK